MCIACERTLCSLSPTPLTHNLCQTLEYTLQSDAYLFPVFLPVNKVKVCLMSATSVYHPTYCALLSFGCIITLTHIAQP